MEQKEDSEAGNTSLCTCCGKSPTLAPFFWQESRIYYGHEYGGDSAKALMSAGPTIGPEGQE